VAVGKLVIRLTHRGGGARVVGEARVSTESEDARIVVEAVTVQLASSWGPGSNRITVGKAVSCEP